MPQIIYAGESLPKDQANKHFDAVRVDNGGTPELVAKAGVNRRVENGQPIADLSVHPTTASTTAPSLVNRTLTNADTEYTIVLPTNCRAFTFRCTIAVDVRFAFAAGVVAAPTSAYFTLPANAIYSKDGVMLAAVTLYLASPVAGAVIQLEAWS